MGIMTIGTGDLALDNWVVRHLAAICALLLVAGIADLGLGAFVANFVVLRMNFVTGGTCNICVRVLTTFPMCPAGTLVTAHAGSVDFGRRGIRFLGEPAVRFRRFVTAFMAYVLFAIAMTISTGRRA